MKTIKRHKDLCYIYITSLQRLTSCSTVTPRYTSRYTSRVTSVIYAPTVGDTRVILKLLVIVIFTSCISFWRVHNIGYFLINLCSNFVKRYRLWTLSAYPDSIRIFVRRTRSTCTLTPMGPLTKNLLCRNRSFSFRTRMQVIYFTGTKVTFTVSRVPVFATYLYFTCRSKLYNT